MIGLLLWRCPLCATNDALAHTSRLFGGERVRCTHCRAEWRLRRVPGDGFYLRQINAHGRPGDERPLAAWYAMMKGTVRLQPLPDAPVALDPGEALYLASAICALEAEEGDGLFFGAEPPGAEPPAMEKGEVAGVVVGQGRLFLTNRRLLWQPAESGVPTASWPLARLNSAYALMDFGLALLVGARLYTLYFLAESALQERALQESALKWVTYLALAAREVLAETGHSITTSHF